MSNWYHCIKKAHLCPKKIAGSDPAVINNKRYNSNQISKTTTNLVNIQKLTRVQTKLSKSNKLCLKNLKKITEKNIYLFKI